MRLTVARLWCQALRGGDYPQGGGQLKNENAEYCCLGVLSELAVEVGVIESFDGDAALLPETVREWAGLRSHSPTLPKCKTFPHTLADWNDEGVSFSEIADVIETYATAL